MGLCFQLAQPITVVELHVQGEHYSRCECNEPSRVALDAGLTNELHGLIHELFQLGK